MAIQKGFRPSLASTDRTVPATRKYRSDFAKRPFGSIVDSVGLALSQKLPRRATLEGTSSQHNPVFFSALMLILGILLGVVVVLLGPPWMQKIINQVNWMRPGGLAAILEAVLLAVAVHEIGHLAAALFFNFRVLEFAVGPLRYERGLRVSWTRFARDNWFYFSVSAVPIEIRNWWRGRVMSVIAAGPLATLILLVISVSFALAGRSAFWSASAEVNVFLFVLGLVPNSRSAQKRNDAQLFLALLRNGDDAADMKACHQALELGLRDERPKDYPEALMLELAACTSGRPFTRLMVAKRQVEWAIDRNDIASADVWDQHALDASSLCNPRLHNIALAESACFDLLFRRNRRGALAKFTEVDLTAVKPAYLAERATAARLIACDLPNAAPAHILLAQRNVPKGPGYYDYERAILGDLHARALSACGGRLLPAPQ